MLRFHHNRGDFIFVRFVENETEVSIPDGSLFGDIPIYNYKEMSGNKDKYGRPYYVFRPLSVEFLPKDHFREGQLVDLVVEETPAWRRSPDM